MGIMLLFRAVTCAMLLFYAVAISAQGSVKAHVTRLESNSSVKATNSSARQKQRYSQANGSKSVSGSGSGTSRTIPWTKQPENRLDATSKYLETNKIPCEDSGRLKSPPCSSNVQPFKNDPKEEAATEAGKVTTEYEENQLEFEWDPMQLLSSIESNIQNLEDDCAIFLSANQQQPDKRDGDWTIIVTGKPENHGNNYVYLVFGVFSLFGILALLMPGFF